ncbi:CotH kinase family protein [Paenibacillus sp. ACRSA]|uniref:CotH kinase family protein n=1 Tax=Paenibacillus sp. ACRSA TaxID=2918211 RepID=UPI001EF4D22F|nr:CotH kinase family protein [Paenibacillus sp. ACRSA]MCG7377757.1 CotH kinase family protein [Paenibacillus sp. ACRSA]
MALPVYHISLSTTEYQQLTSNIWSDTFVNSTMQMDSKQLPIRIRYRGGHTRGYAKKSFEIRTASRTYHFNAEYDDPSLIRNALSFRFFESIRVPAPSTKHCVLYLNGQLLGVYLRIEGVKSFFFRQRKIPVRSIFYAVNDHAGFTLNSDSSSTSTDLLSGYSLIRGKDVDRTRLSTFVRQLNTKSRLELFRFLQSRVDTDNYLRWLSGAVLTGNFDGFHQNYTWYEKIKSGKYGILPWDYEGTWGRNCYGTRVDSNLVRIQGYNKLTGRLLAFRSFRQQYKKLMQQHLMSVFTEKRIMPLVYRMHREISEAVEQDPYMKWPMDVFAGEPERIRTYVAERREYLQEKLHQL